MNPSFRLVLKSGPNTGRTLDLGPDEVVIGRDANANFVISDPEVSRRHARVYLQEANYVIEDLGSTNGTVVSGQRISGPYILRPGEIITLGEHTTVLFEKFLLDPDATIASLRPVEPALPVEVPAVPSVEVEPVFEPVMASKEPPVYAEEEYVGRIPEKPRPARVKKQKSSSKVVILIVVVIVLLCGCIGFAIFDALDLYCNFPDIVNLFIPGACVP